MAGDASVEDAMPVVELVYDRDWPHVLEARRQLLRAFERAKLAARWQEWDRDDANSPARVQGLGSPTILVDGEDVAPADRCDGAACRLYPDEQDGSPHGGAPSVEAIRAALEANARLGGRPDSPRTKGGWTLSLASMPGIGAALLPKVTCPACWPAYAGFLSSAGLGFLLETAYLLPLVATSLAIAVGALAFRARRRRGFGPMFVGLGAALVVVVGKFVFESDEAMYVGLGILIAASLWNSWPRRSHAPAGCPSCEAGAAEAG